MDGFNHIDIIGKITKEPEFKQDKYTILSLRIDCSTNRKREDGTVTKEICYIDVTLFGQKAADLAPQLHTGSTVLVSGRLRQDTWKGKEGDSQSKHKIMADNIILFDCEPKFSPEKKATFDSFDSF